MSTRRPIEEGIRFTGGEVPEKPFHARTFDDDDGGDDDDGDRSTLQHIFSSRLCPSVRPFPSLSSQPAHISSIRSCEPRGRRQTHGAGRARIFTGKLIFICRSHPGRLILIKRSVIWVIRTVVRDSGPAAMRWTAAMRCEKI